MVKTSLVSRLKDSPPLVVHLAELSGEPPKLKDVILQNLMSTVLKVQEVFMAKAFTY